MRNNILSYNWSGMRDVISKRRLITITLPDVTEQWLALVQSIKGHKSRKP